MCFSSEVSAIAGVVLISTGVYLFKNRKYNTRTVYIAVMPFLFGIQQLSESLVWLQTDELIHSSIGALASYFFAFFAYTFWPIYVPSAMFLFESSKNRYYTLALLIIGIAVGLYLFYGYMIYSELNHYPLCSDGVCGSIIYMYEVPYFKEYIKYIYFLPATIPFFITSNIVLKRVVGPAFLISFPIGIYFSTSLTLPSIWCFLAAIISILIIFVFEKKENHD